MKGVAIKGLLLFLWLAWVPGYLAAQTGLEQSLQVRDLGDGWFEAEGEAPAVNITPEAARQQALEDARQRAIMFAVGVDVQGGSFLLQEEGEKGFRDAFLQLSRQTSAGRIVAEKSPKWEMHTGPGGQLSPIYRVQVQVQVAKEEGQPDPGFQVEAKLNQAGFQEGEEMRLAITATRPCYVNVINLTAVDTVIVLLPHKFRQERRVKPGDTLWVPDAEEQNMGIHYRVYLPTGRQTALESIWVVATKEDRSFGEGLPQKGLYNQVPTRQAAMVELMRWLVQIPRDQRAEAQVMYEVRGKKQ